MGVLKFQKLTPTQEVDLSGYEDAFQYIFAENDIISILKRLKALYCWTKPATRRSISIGINQSERARFLWLFMRYWRITIRTI